MKGGSSALVVLLVDGDGGQAATYGPFLIDDNLHSGSKVLLKEMGHSRAPDPSSNNSCSEPSLRLHCHFHLCKSNGAAMKFVAILPN